MASQPRPARQGERGGDGQPQQQAQPAERVRPNRADALGS